MWQRYVGKVSLMTGSALFLCFFLILVIPNHDCSMLSDGCYVEAVGAVNRPHYRAAAGMSHLGKNALLVLPNLKENFKILQ